MRVQRAGTMLVVMAIAVAARADLKSYVNRSDDSFKWEKRTEADLGDVSVVELRLVSQTWREITWKHRLFVARPKETRIENQAILVISGGSWRDEYDQPPGDDAPSPRSAALIVHLAKQSGMPVAFLQHVPFQPMFGGKHEDEIIAYTFKQYLETKDSDWPLLFPMTKSAVRAMDAIQAFAKNEWSLDIQNFMVTGGSKRGWTTWLTGAVDPRVNAIAPMVIDVLNMGPQMRHQVSAWGKFSEQIHDYTDLRIQDQMSSDEGRALNKLVDPYAYRHDLKQPKLLMIGTNDRYWPLDALSLYWDQLVGEKRILYVPNKGHSLDDYRRVLSDATALALQAAGKIKLPDLDWDLTESDAGLDLAIRSTPTPTQVRAWIAHAATRDFREVRWESVDLDVDGGSLAHHLARPKEGFSAMFGEAEYELDGHPVFLSTNVAIIQALDGWTTLFSGRNLDGWHAGRSNPDHKWQVAGRILLDPGDPRKFVIDPGQGVLVNGADGRTRDLYTQMEHGDCELHVEFMVPEGSNSGVYFQSRYEIQILDSFDHEPAKSSDCGGIYQRWIDNRGVGGRAPDFNASKPPGKWQTFDVVFRAPRFDDQGQKTTHARFERVVHNNVIIHEDIELDGPTRGGQDGPEQARAPLRIQGDHGPVAFRNVRIKPLK